MRVFKSKSVLWSFAFENLRNSIHDHHDSGKPWIRMLFSALFLLLVLEGCSSIHCGKPDSGDKSLQPSQEHVADVDRNSFKIVSWNLHGLPGTAALDGRLEKIAKEMLVRKPDIILFQEAWFKGYADFMEHALENEYQRVSDSKALGFNPIRFIFGHRKGGLLAFLRKGRAFSNHEISSEFYTYTDHAPWFRLREADGVSGKGIQFITLLVHGKEIQIFNTHLQSPYPEYDNHLYTEIRAEQIDELLKYVHRSSNPNAIRFMFGDFNTRPSEKILIEKTGHDWTDLTKDYRTECHCDTLLEKHKSQTAEPEWIDYGFVNRGASVKLTSLQLIHNDSPDCPYSDHQGLEFEIAIDASEAMLSQDQ